MDFGGNLCAIICRFILLLLLVYSIILSCMVVSSCHFISAITPPNNSNNSTETEGEEETHGVGLTTFENQSGECEAHNSFVIDNYNGMEMAAKVGGYVAPTLGCLVCVWLLGECCKKGGCWGGKCIPSILLLGAVICQGLTFLLFQSDLFCNNKDIEKCDMGDGGYRSIQATLVYSFCFILHYCGPSPTAIFTIPSKNKRVQEESSSSSKKKKKKKNKPTQPGKGEEWTKEMYEQRRKEKKVKSRGVSGRSKKEIFDDMHNGGSSSSRGNSRDEQYEQSMTIYDPDQQHNSNHRSGSSRHSGGRSHRSDPKYDEYVDTGPDGMDWSQYTPDQRDAYYERQRAKKRERKEREREKKEREKMRQWEDDGLGDPYGDSGRSPRSPGDDVYSVIEYEGNGRGYSDDYSRRHEDNYYSDRDDRRKEDYDMPETHSPSPGRGGEYYDDEYDSMVDGGTNADYSDGEYRSRDDYSYAQDEDGGGSRYEDDYRSNRNPDVYYDEEASPHSSSRQSSYSGSHGGGRSRGTDRSSRYDDSYYSRDSYDRSRQSSYRDPYV